MKRRIFSIITALALCLSLLPTAAWAEEDLAATRKHNGKPLRPGLGKVVLSQMQFQVSMMAER